MKAIRRAAVAMALIFGPAAFAQTFIVPQADCGAVALHVTRGDDFPNPGEKIAAERVSAAYVWALPKERVAAEVTDTPRALAFNATIPDEGVVMAAVAVRPEVRGNETHTEHAKAFVFCGPTPVADWQRSTGLDLEIYPQGWNGPRPHLKPGDAMRFIAVDKATNKILRDLPMELYRAGAGVIAAGVPAPAGGMNFPYPEPGRYVVVATHRRPDPRQPDRWLVDTSTLTFDVK